MEIECMSEVKCKLQRDQSCHVLARREVKRQAFHSTARSETYPRYLSHHTAVFSIVPKNAAV